MADEELKVKITADDNASKVLGGIHGLLGGIGNIAGGVLKVGLLGATAGFAALTAGVGASIKEAIESEEAVSKLNAVIKATGGVAGVTSKAAQDLASAFQKTTKFSDEMVLGAESVLLRFKEINKDVFPEATRLSLDLAQSLGIDATSAATMLGKALEDPGVGLARLKAAGVSFTEEQTKMIKAMGDTGDAAGAQKLILDALHGSIGGAAEAAGTTFAGQLEILKNQFSDIQETLGGAFLPILKDVTTFINANFIPAFKAFVDDIAPKIQGFFKNLPGQIANIQEFATPIINKLKTALEAGDWTPVKDAFWSWLTGKGGALEQVQWKLNGLLTEFNAWLYSSETQSSVSALGQNIGGAIADGISLAFQERSSGIGDSINSSIDTAIKGIQLSIANLGGGIASGLIGGFSDKLGLDMSDETKASISRFVSNLILDINDFVKGGVPGMVGYWFDLIGSQFRQSWDMFVGGLPALGRLATGNLQNFDSGGVVAGPYGSPQLVTARGGETFGGFPPRGNTSPDYVIVGFDQQAFRDFLQPFIEGGIVTARRAQI